MARVLVVDDRSVNRDLVRTILGYEGHDVVDAESGEEALQLVRTLAPDLMISDVLMPGMDGYELAREVHAMPASSQLPIIFYTANYLEEEARPIAAACGVDHVVAKDGDPRALVEAVTQALQAAPTPRPVVDEEDFSREHLRLLNTKLLDKVRELEEKERLTELVDAAVIIGGDLGVHNTLSRIVVTARALVSARYASVRMLDSAGGEIGVASDGIDPRPRGLISATIRLPILARENYHGALDVVGTSTEADFSESDHSLLQAFAAAAGTAMGNAHRYDDARRRQAWLRASAEATSMLLGAAPDVALTTVVRNARLVANADIAWIEVADSRVLVVDPPSPAMTDLVENDRAAAMGAGLLRELAATGEAVLFDDATLELDAAVADVAMRAGIGPLLAVPLQAGEGLVGVLILANERHRRGFSRLDTEMATTFAGQAAVALEFARAQSVRDRLQLVEERGRIARDLHDVVIQRLFAVGLRLEAMSGRVPDNEADHLVNSVEELNHTINDIRNAIFSLRTGEQTRTKLTDRLESVFDRAEQTLGFAPSVDLDTSLDEAVPEHLHLHLLATVNEGLSNVARHASATTVLVQISSSAGMLTATVADDGVGLPPTRTESGLANLRHRAELAAGTMRTEPGVDGRGLTLIWQVPLDSVPSVADAVR